MGKHTNTKQCDKSKVSQVGNPAFVLITSDDVKKMRVHTYEYLIK